jgi:iron(III) transport system substrate-binding protein
MIFHFNPLLPIALVVVAAGLLLPSLVRPNASQLPPVIVYAAQDQVYAEPILKEFEKQTAIRVRTVFDSEATKTVGLANRLLGERTHPQCDVFWGNEEFRTRQLAGAGIFRETNGWAAFGYRSRRIAMPAGVTNLAPPFSLSDLTNPVYRGRIALAYPLFGTTATHLLALRPYWGESNWLAWCRGLAANGPFIVDGNSVAVQFVNRGEAALALTDSDDIAAAIREGGRLKALPMTPETLLIPNTVAVVRNCPHPDAAQKLYEFLQGREVAARLVVAGALEGVSATELSAPTLRPDWDRLLQDLEPATEKLKQIFRR